MEDDIRLLRRAEVCELVGLARSSLYRMINAGNFPRPVMVGPKSVRWRMADVKDFIATRKETLA